MTWAVGVASPAAKALQGFTSYNRKRLLKALASLERNPYSGDIQLIRQRPGVVRRRVGVWRLFFEVNEEAREVRVLAIVRRRPARIEPLNAAS